MAKRPPRMRTTPKAKPWSNPTKRSITGRALQRERERLFADEPLCRVCEAEGRTTVATIRDHVTALAFGGKDVRANTQGLCVPCHDRKTKRESREGRARSMG